MFAILIVTLMMVDGQEITSEHRMHPFPNFAVCQQLLREALAVQAREPSRKVIKAECENIAPPAASWGPPR